MTCTRAGAGLMQLAEAQSFNSSDPLGHTYKVVHFAQFVQPKWIL